MTTMAILQKIWNFESPNSKAVICTIKKQPELIFIFLLVMILNAPLLTTGIPAKAMIYRGSAQDYSGILPVLSHGFVHVSLYHLFIDGIGFFLVYTGLSEKSMGKRITVAIVSCSGAMIAATLSPMTYLNGYCGLSGAAHGLMAFGALEMMEEKDLRGTGILLLLILVSKTAFEVITGTLPLSWMHIGELGKPILVSHAGGVIAGIIGYIGLCKWRLPSFRV